MFRIATFNLEISVGNRQTNAGELSKLRELFNEVGFQDYLEVLVRATVADAVKHAEGKDLKTIRGVELVIMLFKESNG